MRNTFLQQKGLTLIETLVASAIFVTLSISIYQLYAGVFSLSAKIRVKTILSEVAGEQFEFIRNLAYSNVGTVAGIPNGIIDPSQTVTKNGLVFEVVTTIRNIDDPADGTLGGIPNDLSPGDKKLVAIEVTCTSCSETTSLSYTSVVAPKNLETENGNGALVIRAIDANGQPVAGAEVHIVNSSTTPAIDINDVTGVNGVLTIVDAPPATQTYEVTVTKDAHSTEQTYLPGDAANPNPIKPHITVAANTISQATFSIDHLSTFDIVTQSAMCSPLGSISGTLSGTKLIGTGPDILKHQIPFTTNSGGTKTLSSIEWDTYSLSLSGSLYDILGTDPIAPLVVPPESTQTLTITLGANDPNRLVVGVVDTAGLPVADAFVSITGPSGTFDDTTNIGSITQTDWAGGGGQLTVGDWTKFYSSSNVAFLSSGELTLAQSGAYLPSGELVSSVIDLGEGANLRQLTWLPGTQPVGAGVTSVRFQIASATTNDDLTVWSFVGPDGTAATYYSSPTSNISATHDGHRYIKYKLLLSTEDTSVTPQINDVSITYASGCLPPGQVHFGGLSDGQYHATVSKTGFQTTEKDITISGDTHDTITINPE